MKMSPPHESEPTAVDELFPPGVVVALGRPQDRFAPLLPREEAGVRHAVEKRIREFRAGRACARRALARLGVHDFPLVRGADRAPVWPEGVVGSITHCPGFVGAAVARTSTVRALGLDAEPDQRLEEDLFSLICTPRERTWLREVDPAWARALFSAKEAVFKCLHPLTGTWIDFLDVRIEFTESEGRFRAEPASDVPDPHRTARLLGRYVRTSTHWITAAVVP